MTRARRIPVAAMVVVLGLAVAMPIGTALMSTATSAPTPPPTNHPMPVASNDPAVETPAMSADGRYVAFSSPLQTLVAGDTNGASDVFVLDRTTGGVQQASVDSSGTEGDGDSYAPSISADGRYVVFTSTATNLVSGAPGVRAVYRHDLQTGATVLASVLPGGGLPTLLPGASTGGAQQAISDDGRYAVFEYGNPRGVYVRDLVAGTTAQLDVGSGGAAPDGASFDPVISGDGSHVAFESVATNLVAGDTNGVEDVFERPTGSTSIQLVSQQTGGGQTTDAANRPSISQTGDVVAFEWGDAVFVRDVGAGTTTRVAPTGVTPDLRSGDPHVTRDGSAVFFSSDATNLVGGDANSAQDVFRYARSSGAVTRVSVTSAGSSANGSSGAPAPDGDGTIVAFISAATNLGGGVAGRPNMFIRDIAAGTTQVATPAGLPNLVQDGSFEPPGLPHESYFDSFGLPSTTHLGAWQIDRGGVDVIHDVDVPDGLQFLDLNGNGYDPGKISQTITVQEHHLYLVGFTLSANTNGGPTIKTVDVSFGGVTRSFSADLTGHTSSNLGWTGHTFEVAACGLTSSPLVFDSTTPNVDGGQKGPQLDAVTVYDITPPSGLSSCSPPNQGGGATTTSVTSSANPSVSGQSVAWTATVGADGGPAAAGSVQWKVDGVGSGLPVAVGADGTATLVRGDLQPGSHHIEADYLGTDGIDPSQGDLTQTVNKGATTTVVTSSANPVPWGQSVTFTATVSPHAPATSAAGAPGGSVSFSVDGVAASSATLAGGQATFAVDLPPGTHHVAATYAGDTRFTGSQSSAYAESVTCDRTYTGNVSSVVVTSGTACVVGGTIAGSASVVGTGSLALVGATVNVSVSDNRGARLLVCNTHVDGSVVVQASPGPVTVGDPASGCAGNTIVNSLVLVNDTGHVVAVGNQIGRSLVNSGNHDADVRDNTVG
ncbi:MAG TPA: Ig-like domain repeat protein [Acidimicrobiales bacterium]|jgi:Tol biopolymer transport system component|nr:Ig-like domain repeat protein [Acidimicrobiales bacterium]